MKVHAALFVLVWLTACAGKRPQNLGLHGQRLAPCPEKPNCVNSYASHSTHAIAPLQLTGSEPQIRQQLQENLAAHFPDSQSISQQDNYLHYEFRSRWLGFIDDVEFQILPEGLVHFRSASRLGYSDLGVNRRRMEAIRQKLTSHTR